MAAGNMVLSSQRDGWSESRAIGIEVKVKTNILLPRAVAAEKFGFFLIPPIAGHPVNQHIVLHVHLIEGKTG